MSSEVNFQLFQFPIGGVENTSSSSPSQGTTETKDTLGPSQQSEEDARTKGNAAPWLPPPVPITDYHIPDLTVTIESLKALLIKTEQTIIGGLFDKWDESIQQLNDEHRRRQLEEMKKDFWQLAFFAGGSVIGTSGTENPVSTIATSALLLVISSSLDSTLPSPGFSTIESISSIAVNLQFVPPGFQSSLSVLGGMLAALSFYPAILQTLKSLEGKNSDIQNLEFARNYLKQVENVVKHPALNPPDADPVIQKLLAMTKLGLLLTSLALYYRVETGWLTGQEIGGLLSGEIQLPEDDPRKPIISAVFEQLRVFPEEQRSALLEAFFEYFDSKPSVDDLLTVSEGLKNSSSEADQDYVRFTQNAN